MPAIKRYFLEQPAMLLSPMSALKRIADSTRTSRHVRNVPGADMPTRSRSGANDDRLLTVLQAAKKYYGMSDAV
jgi:hypothetical protein